MVQVVVGEQGKLEVAIRNIRRKIQAEGINKEGKLREAYEKPCEKKKRKRKEAIARKKKNRNNNKKN